MVEETWKLDRESRVGIRSKKVEYEQND